MQAVYLYIRVSTDEQAVKDIPNAASWIDLCIIVKITILLLPKLFSKTIRQNI